MERDEQQIEELLQAVRKVQQIAEAERGHVQALLRSSPQDFDEEAALQQAQQIMERFRALRAAAAASKQVFQAAIETDSQAVVHVAARLAELLDLVFKDAAAALQQQATLVAPSAGRMQ